MTIIKNYNATTSQWEAVLVGQEGDWSIPQFSRTVNSSYTLTPSDAGYLINVSASTPSIVRVTQHLNLLPGQRIDILREGLGKVVFEPDGVVINNYPNLSLRAQWSMATLLCISPDVYTVYGDLVDGREDLLTASATVSGALSDTLATISGEQYRIVTWTASGNMTPTSSLDVEYLVVAGGGGGAPIGGGGGGGGLLTNVGGVALTVSSVQTVTVGAGGVGNNTLVDGSDGTASSLGAVSAEGGGGGARQNNDGRAGGSGGGSGRTSSNVAREGGAGTAGQGNDGGSTAGVASTQGAGGGGAGQIGGGGTTTAGGAGGNGLANTITGTSVTYAGGGGAGGTGGTTPGSGGTGGGGNGSSQITFGGQSGTNGLGGGGGGSRQANSTVFAGNGGDGIVIVRWRV